MTKVEIFGSKTIFLLSNAFCLWLCISKLWLETTNTRPWCYGERVDCIREWGGGETSVLLNLWGCKWGLSTRKEDESCILFFSYTYALKHTRVFLVHCWSESDTVTVVITPLCLLDQFPSLYPSYAIQIHKKKRKLILYLEHKCLNQNKGE